MAGVGVDIFWSESESELESLEIRYDHRLPDCETAWTGSFQPEDGVRAGA